MDTSSVLSDDLSDYDVISNPGQRSLESSSLDFGCAAGKQLSLREPPPLDAAKDIFWTSTLSAENIQAYVQRALTQYPSSANGDAATVMRVYVDGAFDRFDVRHALQLRQAKLSFPNVHLVVGVFSDQLWPLHHAVQPNIERCEILRHCRWVDEVFSDAPWKVDDGLLRRLRLDYIALEEGMSIDPECANKDRLEGYDSMKAMHKVVPTRKTLKVATNTTTSSFGVQTSLKDDHIDTYGIGY